MLFFDETTLSNYFFDSELFSCKNECFSRLQKRIRIRGIIWEIVKEYFNEYSRAAHNA